MLSEVRSPGRYTPPRDPRCGPRSCSQSPAQVPGASLLGRRRRLNVVAARPAAALGGAFSLLPLHSAVAASRLASHLSFNARACCEIFSGYFSSSSSSLLLHLLLVNLSIDVCIISRLVFLSRFDLIWH
ncbi:unnamed protein product [Spirodela intermedia]|uniref:Uncharacterized protein n=1 Tax=Spirodela intermedia TaxID=51605 RepID=A0A7I8ICI2_SPIIN|nr:unnamed protein product [Spirodela intermedia]CAA6655460.1 unnamed protein product [Spirodela intermedia]